MLRRLSTLLAVIACVGYFAAPGLALGPRGTGTLCAAAPGGPYPFTLGSTHFLVHYRSDVSSLTCDVNMAVTERQAGDVLGYAEIAYAAEIGTYGYPAPPSDGALGGDNRIDIYILNEDAASTGVLGETTFDGGPPSTTASFQLDAQKGLTPETVARELFHVIQLGIWLPASAGEYWLLQETAEWMAAKVNNYEASYVGDLGPADISLDCKDPRGTSKCDLKDGYENDGFSRWPFWQSVTQKYGTSFVKEVFQHGAANPGETGVAALQGALAVHSTNLTDAFNDWTVQQMAGTYGLSVLDQIKPKVWGQPVLTGTTTKALATINVPVNHLANRFLEFDRGDGAGTTSCFAATLALTVTIPAGVASKPYFYWNGLNSAPVALAVNGSTASATVPWDTCTWVGNQAYLSLPNPSTDPTANGAVFSVVATLTVDLNTPGQASLPPAAAPVSGTIVPVGSTEGVPSISVFGPELMTGYLNSGAANPLSRLTIGAMEDLGYTVNYSVAQTYLRTFTAAPMTAGATQKVIDLRGDVPRQPIYIVDRNNRITGVARP